MQRWRKSLGVVVLAVAVSAAALTGCVSQTVPYTHLEIPFPDVPLLMDMIPGFREGNFRNMEWTEAFDALHGKISAEYPFTEHKQVDWEALYDAYAPRIAKAADEEDACAYYDALRGYLYSVPDAGIALDVSVKCMDEAIGGSYGFGCIEIEGGEVIAHVIQEGGPAEAAGMQFGAKILNWNGRPHAEALAAVPTLWADTVPATDLSRRIAQLQLLSRAPVGEKAAVIFRNPGAGAATEATLRAESDDYECLYMWADTSLDIGELESAFSTKQVDGYGVITLRFVAPTVLMPFPARGFRKAIVDLVDRGVPGLILDLRGNAGGDDTLVPRMVGHFTATESLYEDASFAKDGSGEFVLMESRRQMIEPRDPAFMGPVVVLVDYATTGAGEGLAMALQRLPQVQVLGFTSTQGAFSQDGGSVTMPGGHNVFYPVGRSLDAAGRIQLESDGRKGGVRPDVQLPVTYEAVEARFQDGEDVLMEKAVALLNAATGR